jgi:RimJ/RimL family protein N-acetyltransferase
MNREPYVTDGVYSIFPISEEDRDNYVELHRQLNGAHSLYLNPFAKDIMWETTLHGKNRVYSIYDKDHKYCGSIELQNPEEDTPEIGIDLLESMRNKGIAPKVVPMFARKTYEIKSALYFLIRISSENPHSKHVFEKMGASLIGEEISINGVVYQYKLVPKLFT